MKTSTGQSRIIVLAVTAILVIFSVSAEAQRPTKVQRIAYVTSNSLSAESSRVGAFRQGLRDLGYIDGQNIVIEYRYAGGANFDRLPNLVGELLALNIDVFVTATTAAALAAKNATRTVPIVFLGVTDPVAAGLIDGLARPGGNLTGVTNIAAVLIGKRLDLLKEADPKLFRVAVLWDPQNQAAAEEWNESQLSARALGLQLHSMKVSIADQYESAFREAARAQCTALVVTQHVLAVNNIGQIVDLAAKHRFAAMYPRAQFVDAGGLMSYGPSLEAEARAVAQYVDKILKGSKPADLPVEQPKNFEFLINLKTAKQIGITIPPNVLARADKVIR